jgi:hypothetical protein
LLAARHVIVTKDTVRQCCLACGQQFATRMRRRPARRIDTGSYSFPYIATWTGTQDGPALLKQVMGKVQAIVHQLIAGITANGDAPTIAADAPGQDTRRAA